MSRRSEKTIKRLYAISQNQCAFPNCTARLVDSASGKVTGRICHIKGNRPGAKRYDPAQTEEERQSYDNLILMCPSHHDIIDNDEVTYPVERLKAMKSEHESNSRVSESISDVLVNQFLVTLENNILQNGSIIVTHNQMGGQVAHSITNIGPQPRRLTEAVQKQIAWRLLQLEPHSYEIEVNSDDADGRTLAYQITQILNTANWTCRTFASSIFPRPMIGITISFPAKSPAVTEFIAGLRHAEFRITEAVLPTLGYVHILIGYRENAT